MTPLEFTKAMVIKLQEAGIEFCLVGNSIRAAHLLTPAGNLCYPLVALSLLDASRPTKYTNSEVVAVGRLFGLEDFATLDIAKAADRDFTNDAVRAELLKLVQS